MLSVQEFYQEVRRDYPGHWVYRGQSNRSWGLETTYSRFCRQHGLPFSFEGFLELLGEFIGRASDLESKDLSQIDLQQQIAFAQHHGLVTPFLDWTFSPYVALYFAIGDKLISWDDGEPVRVWSFNVNAMEESAQLGEGDDMRSLLQASSFLFSRAQNFHSKRIHKQQGCFTFHNFAGDLNRQDALLDRFTIELRVQEVSGDWKRVAQELKLMNITGGNLFGNVDYLARDVIMDALYSTG